MFQSKSDLKNTEVISACTGFAPRINRRKIDKIVKFECTDPMCSLRTNTMHVVT
jgi:hypothetical protein